MDWMVEVAANALDGAGFDFLFQKPQPRMNGLFDPAYASPTSHNLRNWFAVVREDARKSEARFLASLDWTLTQTVAYHERVEEIAEAHARWLRRKGQR